MQFTSTLFYLIGIYLQFQCEKWLVFWDVHRQDPQSLLTGAASLLLMLPEGVADIQVHFLSLD